MEAPLSQCLVIEDQEFATKALATKFYPQCLSPGNPESPSKTRVPKSLWEKPSNQGVTSVYHCLAYKYSSSQEASVMMPARQVHLGKVVACHNCDRTYCRWVDWVTRVSHWNKSSEFTLLTFTTFVPRPEKVKIIFRNFRTPS